jgi:hypothetical protein
MMTMAMRTGATLMPDAYQVMAGDAIPAIIVLKTMANFIILF